MEEQNFDEALDIVLGDEWDQLAWLNALEEEKAPPKDGVLADFLLNLIQRIVAAVTPHPVRQP